MALKYGMCGTRFKDVPEFAVRLGSAASRMFEAPLPQNTHQSGSANW
jgi:hypothetical protein